MKILTLLVLALSPAFAEDQAKPIKPTISWEQRALFWRSLSEFNVSKTAFDKAQAALLAAQGEMVKVCGADYTVQLDQRGEPSCAANPKPESKQESKPESQKTP